LRFKKNVSVSVHQPSTINPHFSSIILLELLLEVAFLTKAMNSHHDPGIYSAGD